ncbi:hypothetical protein SteCoe_11774 [Stentor coeruleus]|uniref:14-3-3 domain-containing protein n=1 Tax=Stentor coeruleus TaxID=5963 RepID=A0A1R2CCH2_9CILI|nr:hypothetical protein SteCoe_11774 [Stentor coeruleus]
MTKDEIEFLLSAAEQAEDNDKAFSLSYTLLEKTSEFFSQKEITNISLGIKRKLNSLRLSYKILQNIENQHKNIYELPYILLFQDYKNKIKNEYHESCSKVIESIEKHIEKYDKNSQESAHFIKLKGDLYKNISEIEVGQSAENSRKLAEFCQEEAERIIYKHLSPAHPTRLGLALSRAVWAYEITNNIPNAIKIAQNAYSEGFEHIEDLTSDILYKDSITIMNLLQSNLKTWLSD